MASILKLKNGTKTGTVAWFNEAVERSKSGEFAEVVRVSPGLAEVMLSRNPNNRHIRPVKTLHYATDMANGAWTLNLEPIIISTTGELNDGQHRLNAIIEANVSIPMLVAFGASRESRLTVDQGAARGAGDYLAMDGVKNATLCAGIARLVMAYEQSDGAGFGGRKETTHHQIVQRVHADSDIHESARFAQSVCKYAKGLLNPSLIGFCHYVFAELNGCDAEEYLTQVCVGEGIKRKDPAFAVRSALTNFEKSSKFARIEMVMRGWNAYRAGRQLTLAKTLGKIPALV